jgi:uncharacterized protein YjiS (DUF1127 family)
MCWRIWRTRAATPASGRRESSAIPSIPHPLRADVLRFSINPARSHSAPKETVMLQELRHRFSRWLAYRQTITKLRQAPDSTLADAGIPRDEIRQRARHASQAL